MHREVVEDHNWIGDRRFLHALYFCSLLPGPEAQQLATYLGWLMHGAVGGLIAGAALSVGTHQLIGSWLPKAAAFDGAALFVASLVLALVSGCAVLLPAVRAAHIAPTEALRSDG